MNATHPLAHLVHGFFQEYMAAQRGLSPNTILSYRDALKLFLCFASQRAEKPVDKLVLEDFDEILALKFLDDLEAGRGNCTAVRNNRLAAVRAFFRYVAGQDPPRPSTMSADLLDSHQTHRAQYDRVSGG